MHRSAASVGSCCTAAGLRCAEFSIAPVFSLAPVPPWLHMLPNFMEWVRAGWGGGGGARGVEGEFWRWGGYTPRRAGTPYTAQVHVLTGQCTTLLGHSGAAPGARVPVIPVLGFPDQYTMYSSKQSAKGRH